MRRSEFIDDVTLFCELRDFCYDNDISRLDEYFDSDDLDDNVYEDMRNCDYSWTDLRDALRCIPEGYDFYYREGYFDYTGCDNTDFESLKDEVLEIMDNRGDWDYEEDDEDEDDEDYDEECCDDPEDEYVYRDPVIEDPNADVSISSFFELPVIGG